MTAFDILTVVVGCLAAVGVWVMFLALIGVWRDR